MGERDAAVAAVDLLAPAFERAGLDELELSVGELTVRIARPAPQATVAAAPGTAPAAAEPPPSAPAAHADVANPFGEPAPGMRFVTAPLTGVWYTAPSPGARPYVAVGDEVTTGQVLGLIEAMKLFNEIKSDVSGTVTRLLADPGTLVKRRQPIVEIDPR